MGERGNEGIRKRDWVSGSLGGDFGERSEHRGHVSPMSLESCSCMWGHTYLVRSELVAELNSVPTGSRCQVKFDVQEAYGV